MYKINYTGVFQIALKSLIYWSKVIKHKKNLDFVHATEQPSDAQRYSVAFTVMSNGFSTTLVNIYTQYQIAEWPHQ